LKYRAAVSWSGGKDGCLALHRVKDQFEVRALVTMLTEDGARTRSHGLRPAVIERHAASLKAETIFGHASWTGYEEEFIRVLRVAKEKGASHSIFGDVFPDPHRKWVERVCREAGVEAVLPLWANSTRELAHEFVAAGGVAQIVTARASVLDVSWLGRVLNAETLTELEAMGVDPCGENGEFHTLVTAMPGLIAPMATREAARLSHGGCWLLDLELC
jgi:diphthine-ammonia ligase